MIPSETSGVCFADKAGIAKTKSTTINCKIGKTKSSKLDKSTYNSLKTTIILRYMFDIY